MIEDKNEDICPRSHFLLYVENTALISGRSPEEAKQDRAFFANLWDSLSTEDRLSIATFALACAGNTIAKMFLYDKKSSGGSDLQRWQTDINQWQNHLSIPVQKNSLN